jgi:hypothetical protein
MVPHLFPAVAPDHRQHGYDQAVLLLPLGVGGDIALLQLGTAAWRERRKETYTSWI